MRIVAWNCNMAFHRKAEALLALDPDVAVISECAEPDRLLKRGMDSSFVRDPVWVGKNPNKGLAVFAFNGCSARLATPYYPTLHHIAPVHVDAEIPFNLLATWALNLSGGNVRKRQSGPLRRALTKYQAFLTDRPAVIAGDFNNNKIWDKPGWRINHMTKVALMEKMGLVSAYHEVMGEEQGEESIPTHYWRDRKKDGPTYHIDYVFMPAAWVSAIRTFRVGTFEDWCGSGLSDHVPLVVDVDDHQICETFPNDAHGPANPVV